MDSEVTEDVRFNKEGGELFKSGRYVEAAERYQSAILADRSNSPVYFCNLSAAYLKLAKFALAETAAHTSLVRDARSIKARFRRAMARKELGRLAEALVLASLLTTAPMNPEGLNAYREISAAYAASKGPRISPEDIVEADFPAAYGSVLKMKFERATPSSVPPQGYYPLGNLGTPPDPGRTDPLMFATCRACKASKNRNDIKTCRKCQRANYCNAACQRADWASHKESCNRPPDNNLTIRFGRELPDHVYIRTHLLFYGARALGLLAATDPTVPSTRLLLVIVDMVPLPDPASERKRIRIKQLLAAPLAVLPEEIEETHAEIIGRTQLMYPATPLVGVCILTSGVYGQDEETRYRVVALPLPPFLRRDDAKLPLRSHSFGVERTITMDLDFLHASLEDELRTDMDNHYKLQT
ncbi:hypothetical protein B0H11DRAFT_2049595 [Mycena galericulata]|nr:hypothetical protein B0H11DRAFT_2049595 [Mycena galericulata]